MAKIYGIIGTKGGTTKTSNCANFGGILADMGQKVLLIDGDNQQSLSAYYPVETRSQYGLKKFITQADATDCISKTFHPNMDIILNDDPDNELKIWFSQSSSHYEYLKYALKSLQDKYDYIIIDTKGESDGAIQESVIKSVDELIAPITPEFMAAKEFKRGTLRMLSRLRGPGDVELFTLPPLKVVICRQKKTAASRQVVNQLRKIAFEEEKGRVSILDTVLFEKDAFNVACGKRLPVHRVEPARPNKTSPTPSAQELMLSLVRELLPHLEDVTPQWEGMPRPTAEVIAV